MLRLFVDYLNAFFLYYMFIYAIVFFISTIFAILNLNEDKRNKMYLNELSLKSTDNYVPVSILVPAYNEEETICDCVESLSYVDYPEYEIIVIDDGSNDDTSNKLINKFELKKVPRPIRRLVKCKNEQFIYEGYIKDGIKLILVKKENGGKADALNMGINVSKYPLFISLDADSILQRDSISNIVMPFMEDDTTIAVGGSIKVANQVVLDKGKVIKVMPPKKILTIFQTIEYYRVFLTTRVWFNSFNGNLIISGAFGLFKKNAVLNVGGYDTDTVGEDMDLVVKLHSFYRKNKIKYKIKYEYKAICWSQVPEKLKDLKGQRRRWHIGLITSLNSHRYIFLNPKYGLVGIFSFLYFVVYEMFSCIIDVFGLIIILISYFSGLLNLKFLITFLFIYIFYSIIISLTAIILENYMFKYILKLSTLLKLMLFAFLESFGYRQLCSWYRITGFIGYRKRKYQWNKISRKKQNKIK
ncbi:glycosyltransferase family 2 protein [Paraclostridium bifermentans]|uniref:glycosyltransferase family 2 protein n=1 Tax=Paraclostridium bifermentans TaxID=1490 RepID=UPI0011DE3791|nr:glycosyltransferase [Paraclostridium bifermentans]MBS5953076.1 glycosyltransferase family 2 protein [Paraclostridium bifermentans]MBS6506883.1 glycosyltransferase family 2 protein [Paraclostridium bifermentans]MBU5287411.1 glycosyltransferase family 2 protein [Paraclostridium bifermentans]MDU3336100.1 glycosyltransferase [Paraclostridium bifermentans]MDU3801934.1 glycosyltransferase [Paraclostridium bifermentans]